MTAVSAVIFLVRRSTTWRPPTSSARRGGRVRLAIAYSCVLIAIMLAVIGLIQLGVGERKLGRREAVALRGAGTA